MTQRPKKVTWTFVALFLLFIVPLLLASWLSYTKKPLSTHTTNHGQLIRPPLDLNQLTLANEQQAWKNHWLLLYVTPSTCDQSCEKMLYDIRQIRTATGKDMDRVERAILTFTSKGDDPHLAQLLTTEFVGTFHLTTSQKNFTAFIQNDTVSKETVLQEGGIYVVDPLGNMMMFYTIKSNPMDIFNDLTHLLKLSHIG